MTVGVTQAVNVACVVVVVVTAATATVTTASGNTSVEQTTGTTD